MTALAIVTLSMRATSNARVASLSSELVLAISLSLGKIIILKCILNLTIRYLSKRMWKLVQEHFLFFFL